MALMLMLYLALWFTGLRGGFRGGFSGLCSCGGGLGDVVLGARARFGKAVKELAGVLAVVIHHVEVAGFKPETTIIYRKGGLAL